MNNVYSNEYSMGENASIIDDFKNFDWQCVIDYGNSLSDLNEAQLRFLKGLAVEYAIERYADGNLTYVGMVGKDFDWPKHNISVEAKSQFSDKMFYVNGDIRKKFSIKFTNTNGTNKQVSLTAKDIPEYVLVVLSDGAFVIDKEIVVKNAVSGGDGFKIEVTRDEIIPLTEKLVPKPIQSPKIAERLARILRESLDNITHV